MKTLSTLTLATAAIAFLPTLASAEAFSWYEKVNPIVPDTASSTVGPQLDLTLGAGVGYAPEFDGSDDYEGKFLPIVDIRYQDMIFLTHRDGLGINALRGQNYALGLSLLPEFGREEGDNAALTGLGDIDATVEGGIFAAYYEGPFSLEGRLHHDLGGEHDGMTGQIRAGATHSFTPSLYGAVDVYLDYASDDYMSAYYGVTAAQAGASGYNQFSAGGGLNQASIAGNLTYMMSPGWFMNGTVAYTGLLGDAKDSPISDDDSQFMIGVQSGYRF